MYKTLIQPFVFALVCALSCREMVLTAATLPSGFTETAVGSGWNEVVGLTVAPDGRLYAWERGGKVWLVENGVKSATPFIDISEEVGAWRDFGLLGFCLHPDFPRTS